jgi:hypothetical protein
VVEFREADHTYWSGHERVPSVTEILGIISSPHLVPWSARQAASHINRNLPRDRVLTNMEINKLCVDAQSAHTRVRDNAAAKGTKVHKAIEEFLLTPEGLKADLAVPTAFWEWYRSHDIETIEVEKKLFYDADGVKFAGTVDWIGRINREPWIIDWKTSRYISPVYTLQLTAYALAWGHGMPRLGVGHIRDGKFELHEVEWNEPAWQAAYTLWRWKDGCN